MVLDHLVSGACSLDHPRISFAGPAHSPRLPAVRNQRNPLELSAHKTAACAAPPACGPNIPTDFMMPLGTLLLALLLSGPQDTPPNPAPEPQQPEAEPEPAKVTAPRAADQGPAPPVAGAQQQGPPEVPIPESRKTAFVFSPAQTAPWDPSLVWSQEWYSMDDPMGAGAEPALAALGAEQRRIYYSVKSGRTILVRDIVGFESPFDAIGADEERSSRAGELITEADGSLAYQGEELIYIESRWLKKPREQRVVAIYSPVRESPVREAMLRSIWIVGEPKASYAELLAEAKRALPRLLGPIGAQTADSYFSILGQHALGFELCMPGGSPGSLNPAAPIVLKPVAAPREGERAYIDSVFKANPQFKIKVVQSWMDAENDVSLSYQIVENDAGLGRSDPFVEWLGGQYQRFHRDSKDQGDFPVEVIHDAKTLTQVISSQEVSEHYGRNKRALDAGVILGVTLTRSPYADNVQIYWMSSADETFEYGYARMVGLRQYVRSRSETISRNSVAMLMLRGSDPEAIERAAAGLNLRTLPLNERLEFPR